MTPDDIRAVQRLLCALGQPVTVDGAFGPRTRDAVRMAILEAVPADTDPETDTLVAELMRDEGTVLSAYQDHLGWWTIGTGRLIDKRKGGGITQAEAASLLRNDIAKVRAQLDAKLPWWRDLSPVRQRALQNMAFQLGIAGLLGFANSLAAVKAGDWARAAASLRQSKWRRQTPERAERIIRMIETGEA